VGEEHAVLLRLAAGGFRDMTRVAGGRASIWPEVVVNNAEAVLGTLDGLVAELLATRELIVKGDKQGLLSMLEAAGAARGQLTKAVELVGRLCELKVPVLDRPGVLAEVTTLAGELGVNIFDLEIAHSGEGSRGVLELIVGEEGAVKLEEGLVARGYHVAVQVMD